MHDPPGRQKLPHPEVVSGVSTITRAMKSLLKRDTTNSILGGTGKNVLTVRLLNKPKRVANRSVLDASFSTFAPAAIRMGTGKVLVSRLCFTQLFATIGTNCVLAAYWAGMAR